MNGVGNEAPLPPCDECATQLVVGFEYLGDYMNRDIPASQQTVAVDWCPNPNCPSNQRPRGFRRISPNTYVCVVCEAEIVAYIEDVFTHRKAHEG